MKIHYNLTGTDRKSLVNAINQELNTSAKYLGAPTFSYEVGDYIIDKNGMLTGPDNSDLVDDLQGLHDFKSITEEYDTPLPESEPVPEDVQIAYDAALGGRVSPYRDFEEPSEYGWPEPDESNNLIIEMPRASFTDATLENLRRLIKSKSTLIKKAIGTDSIPILVNKDVVAFPWFQGEFSEDEVNAYTHFITTLCDMANKQNRITATEKPVENAKYAFGCFLLRLGFIGSEFKMERKILLSKLTGNSAFKSESKIEVIDNESLSL